MKIKPYQQMIEIDDKERLEQVVSYTPLPVEQSKYRSKYKLSAQETVSVIKKALIPRLATKFIATVIEKDMLENPRSYLDCEEFVQFVEDYVELKSLREENLNRRKNKLFFPFSDYPFCFVVANMPYSEDLLESYKILKGRVDKAMSKKWIINAVWSYEFFTDKGQHCHCNIIFHRNGKKESEIVREIKNTFKNVLDVSNSHILCFRYISLLDYPKTLKYIIGLKADDEKIEFVQKDLEFKQINGIGTFEYKGSNPIEGNEDFSQYDFEEESSSRVKEIKETTSVDDTDD